MDDLENGWYLKAQGYMTSEPLYQQINSFKAARAIESDGMVTFVRVLNGTETLTREYVSKGKYDALKAENADLRELAKDACTVLRGFYKPEWFDETVFTERMRELGIEASE